MLLNTADISLLFLKKRVKDIFTMYNIFLLAIEIFEINVKIRNNLK